MTERAKRAAEEFRRRGWQMDMDGDEQLLDRPCQQCGYQMRSDSRFCQNCGIRVELSVAQSSLADIEAAIAAAMDDA